MSAPKPRKVSSFRIHYVGQPGPSSPVPPKGDAYRTTGGRLLTFAGFAAPMAVAGFGPGGRKAA